MRKYVLSAQIFDIISQWRHRARRVRARRQKPICKLASDTKKISGKPSWHFDEWARERERERERVQGPRRRFYLYFPKLQAKKDECDLANREIQRRHRFLCSGGSLFPGQRGLLENAISSWEDVLKTTYQAFDTSCKKNPVSSTYLPSTLKCRLITKVK